MESFSDDDDTIYTLKCLINTILAQFSSVLSEDRPSLIDILH